MILIIPELQTFLQGHSPQHQDPPSSLVDQNASFDNVRIKMTEEMSEQILMIVQNQATVLTLSGHLGTLPPPSINTSNHPPLSLHHWILGHILEELLVFD